MAEGITIKDIADAIATGKTDRAALLERLQYWTEWNWLAPLGQKHEGSGRWRRFPPEAVFVAAVFEELTAIRPHPVQCGQISVLLWSTLRPEPQSNWPEWIKMVAEARKGEREVYLSSGYAYAAIGYEPFAEYFGEPPPSAVVVNLTKVFSQLR